METYKIRKSFISRDESEKIVSWINSIDHVGDDCNHHLTELAKSLKGTSYIFDISNTSLTNYITKFQSISDVSKEPLPDFIHVLIDRIAEEFNFPTDNIFLQAVVMNSGGKINPHYDPSLSGYVNYKCNLSVLSDSFDLFIDKESINVDETDLYGFEASLYKHWTNELTSRRVFLSFGFILPYSFLNRDDNDPRVRLSKRIEKYFQV